MNKPDPLLEGSDIFLKLFEEMKQESITDPMVLEYFLKKLIDRTEGWIIVDFLDSGNWDFLGSFEIDKETGFLILHWHQYDTAPKDHFLNILDYKPQTTSLIIDFKDLQMEKIAHLPFVTIRGYAVKNKEITKYLNRISNKVTEMKDDSTNFYSVFEADHGDHSTLYYFCNTPIYSVLLLPKDNALDTTFSQRLLFLHNYHNCRNRIAEVHNSINGHESDDEICGKANIIRRVFEFLLKIECCYHHEFEPKAFGEENKFSFKKKDYSDMMLGYLIGIIEHIKSEDEKRNLNRIVRLSNELSHDSGKRVSIKEIYELSALTVAYIDVLIVKLNFKKK